MSFEPSLEGSRLKLRGAMENLESIYSATLAFVETDAHKVTVKFEEEAGCHVARLNVSKEPDPQLGVKVGELVHNLRSALDHIAWQMARVGSSAKVCKKRRAEISFPVCHACEEFDGLRMRDLIGEDALALMRRFQPYHRVEGPRDHWLARLNRLWNRDKHRLVHAALTLSDVGKAAFVPHAIRIEDMPVEMESLIKRYRLSGIHDGAEVAYIRFQRPDPQSQKVEVKKQPPSQVFFASGEDAFTHLSLGQLCAQVATVIDRFEPLFATE